MESLSGPCLHDATFSGTSIRIARPYPCLSGEPAKQKTSLGHVELVPILACALGIPGSVMGQFLVGNVALNIKERYLGRRDGCSLTYAGSSKSFKDAINQESLEEIREKIEHTVWNRIIEI